MKNKSLVEQAGSSKNGDLSLIGCYCLSGLSWGGKKFLCLCFIVETPSCQRLRPQSLPVWSNWQSLAECESSPYRPVPTLLGLPCSAPVLRSALRLSEVSLIHFTRAYGREQWCGETNSRAFSFTFFSILKNALASSLGEQVENNTIAKITDIKCSRSQVCCFVTYSVDRDSGLWDSVVSVRG